MIDAGLLQRSWAFAWALVAGLAVIVASLTVVLAVLALREQDAGWWYVPRPYAACEADQVTFIYPGKDGAGSGPLGCIDRETFERKTR